MEEKEQIKFIVQGSRIHATGVEIHANTNLQANPALQLILESVHGVEEVFITKKYEAFMWIGELFDRAKVIADIEQKLREHFEP